MSHLHIHISTASQNQGFCYYPSLPRELAHTLKAMKQIEQDKESLFEKTENLQANLEVGILLLWLHVPVKVMKALTGLSTTVKHINKYKLDKPDKQPTITCKSTERSTL